MLHRVYVLAKLTSKRRGTNGFASTTSLGPPSVSEQHNSVCVTRQMLCVVVAFSLQQTHAACGVPCGMCCAEVLCWLVLVSYPRGATLWRAQHEMMGTCSGAYSCQEGVWWWGHITLDHNTLLPLRQPLGVKGGIT